MISTILIEALARRAHTVALNACGGNCPSMEIFRDEFNAELARFAITPEQSQTVAPPKRALLLPSTQPSLGKGIGQQTGGSADSDAAEAKRILTLIANVDDDVISATCGDKAGSFIREMRVRLSFGGPLCVTGKQTFWLRDISQALIEKGYV